MLRAKAISPFDRGIEIELWDFWRSHYLVDLGNSQPIEKNLAIEIFTADLCT